MKTLEIQLRVQNRLTLDDDTKELMVRQGEFKLIPPLSLAQLWRGHVPNALKLNINVHETAVCIADDWVTVIFGQRLIDCVRALCVLEDTLVNALGGTVTVVLLSSTGGEDSISLDKQLRRERIQGRLLAVLWYVLTLIIGAILGVLAQRLLGG